MLGEGARAEVTWDTAELDRMVADDDAKRAAENADYTRRMMMAVEAGPTMRPYHHHAARRPAAKAAPKPVIEAGFIEDPATEKQIEFVRSLIARKDSGWSIMPEEILVKNFASKKATSALIDDLMKCYDKPRPSAPSPERPAAPTNSPARRIPASRIPAGRYALTGADGTTDFYSVDKPTEGKWTGYTFVNLIRSSIRADGRFAQRGAAGQAILARIEAAGPRESMARYGHEIGSCGMCNRTLTDPESIRLGIGPICLAKGGW